MNRLYAYAPNRDLSIGKQAFTALPVGKGFNDAHVDSTDTILLYEEQSLPESIADDFTWIPGDIYPAASRVILTVTAEGNPRFSKRTSFRDISSRLMPEEVQPGTIEQFPDNPRDAPAHQQLRAAAKAYGDWDRAQKAKIVREARNKLQLECMQSWIDKGRPKSGPDYTPLQKFDMRHDGKADIRELVNVT